jgi:hypothetical protein
VAGVYLSPSTERVPFLWTEAPSLWAVRQALRPKVQEVAQSQWRCVSYFARRGGAGGMDGKPERRGPRRPAKRQRANRAKHWGYIRAYPTVTSCFPGETIEIGLAATAFLDPARSYKLRITNAKSHVPVSAPVVTNSYWDVPVPRRSR